MIQDGDKVEIAIRQIREALGEIRTARGFGEGCREAATAPKRFAQWDRADAHLSNAEHVLGFLGDFLAGAGSDAA